jgi:uncharacterized OB-fold protein
LEWVEHSGRCRLAAFTCIRIIPPTMQVWGYDRQNPYCSGVVELEEGGRVVALIDEVDPTRPEEIMVGMPLTLKYRPRGGIDCANDARLHADLVSRRRYDLDHVTKT